MAAMTTAQRADIGVFGLAVMGSNLARNFGRHGYTVAVHNRTQARTADFMAAHGTEASFLPSTTVEEFVASLEPPRRILMMVKAGGPIDATIASLVPHLERGDIVVDGGNAYFEDTRRREAALREHELHFVGAGISGGEEGALNRPSIMPGGSRESYDELGPLLETIAAKFDDEPCCAYIGPDGAGHFVKMVRNGIEYANEQFLAEAYDLLRSAGLDPARIAEVFREWYAGDLASYLLEMSVEVLGHVDAATGRPFVVVVADAAEQMGTGRWTAQTALELGVPVNAIAEAVFARSASGDESLRVAARSALSGPKGGPPDDIDRLVDDVRAALAASTIVAYAQGLDELRVASAVYGWDLDVAAVASIWHAGCIIRARLLERIRRGCADGDQPTLLTTSEVAPQLATCQEGWRRVVGLAADLGIPVPGFSSTLAYYDTLRRDRLPAAL